MSPAIPVTICLHRGTSLVSKLIRWQTRSRYSHASILIPGGSHYEAREGKGVLKHEKFTLTNPTEQVDKFVVYVTPQKFVEMVAFLDDQVGKGYDWTMVARFVSRRQASRGESGQWFCSELVFAALEKAGVTLLRDTEPWEVSPGLLSKSPILIPA